MPRGAFRTLLREAGVKDPDEAFDGVVRYNALRFIKLVKATAQHEGEMIFSLRKMARYQLEAMSCCIGTRVIGPAAVR